MRIAALLAAAVLAAAPPPAKTDPDGTTALHWAAHNEDLAAARKLVAAGAD